MIIKCLFCGVIACRQSRSGGSEIPVGHSGFFIQFSTAKSGILKNLFLEIRGFICCPFQWKRRGLKRTYIADSQENHCDAKTSMVLIR
jgi:hypothetical protein